MEHEIAFGLENIGVSKEIMEKRIKECIKVTEIEHLVDKAPFELSGGEQQRVAIASILALEPKVLILDEPTALLDPYMAQKIINLLKKIQLDQKITIIISEHRLDLIMPFADEIILINEGKIIEHDLKENVINGNNFDKIHINKPLIYSITRQLKEKNLYKDKIPASIPEAMEFFEKWV